MGNGLTISTLLSAFGSTVLLAALSAIGQFAFLPYYPVWSMIIIAMDILIIWALAKQIRQA